MTTASTPARSDTRPAASATARPTTAAISAAIRLPGAAEDRIPGRADPPSGAGHRRGRRGPADSAEIEQAAEDALGQEDDEDHQEDAVDEVVITDGTGPERDAQHLGQHDRDHRAHGGAEGHV